ncbi:hypothetical protein J2X68_007312 [Streptomyces sp. 3330]|uniref:hypothetical protein n=1 Tax=Streptomyces sp. 3330 TaxID=2817755 RepID=UPI00285C9A22|nr:hypothetical protein [Streptomyces sp. 3330]MDR6980572.1 hypothetical protein [Streptomyces sp. 3330]
MQYTPIPLSATLRLLAVVTASLAVGTALSGCSSGEKQGYSLPRSLCGVSVDPDLLAPFLPPGEEVSTRQATPNGGTQRCNVSVDGELALVAGRLWWEKAGSVADVAAVHAQVNKGKVITGHDFLHSGTGAVGKVGGCTDPAHPDQALFTVVQVFASGRKSPSTMQRLITDYTEQIKKGSDCT